MIIKSKEDIQQAFTKFQSLKTKEQSFNRYALFLSMSINSYWRYYNECLLNINNVDCQYFINTHELVITTINANIETRHLYFSEKIATAWMKKNNPNLFNFEEKQQKEDDIKLEVVVQPFKINE